MKIIIIHIVNVLCNNTLIYKYQTNSENIEEKEEEMIISK